ncbi:hypothetical protein [Virgibacillus ainsalahensis]
MKVVANGFSKFIIANLVVIFVIMLLPVFLITDSVSFLDSILKYLFNH